MSEISYNIDADCANYKYNNSYALSLFPLFPLPFYVDLFPLPSLDLLPISSPLKVNNAKQARTYNYQYHHHM